MKIVYTLWTRPGAFTRDDAYRWSLSNHLANKHGYQIELVTDTNGQQIAKNLGLSFDNIRTDLNDLIDIDPVYWAAGKLVAYRIQDEPFCHIDDDVFLFKPLPESFLSNDLFAQSPETDEKMMVNYTYCIECHDKNDYEKVSLPLEDFDCYNAGILGGSDLDFIHAYADAGLDWLREMTAQGRTHRTGMVLAEQTLFAKMAREQGKTISCLLSNYGANEECRDLGYTHLVNQKFWPVMKKKIRRRLKREAPANYNLIKHHYASSV